MLEHGRDLEHEGVSFSKKASRWGRRGPREPAARPTQVGSVHRNPLGGLCVSIGAGSVSEGFLLVPHALCFESRRLLFAENRCSIHGVKSLFP